EQPVPPASEIPCDAHDVARHRVAPCAHLDILGRGIHARLGCLLETPIASICCRGRSTFWCSAPCSSVRLTVIPSPRRSSSHPKTCCRWSRGRCIRRCTG